MSFNLVAEFRAPVDWSQLQHLVSDVQPELELFPIPAVAAHERDALGIQVPMHSCGPIAQRKLKLLIEQLWAKYDASVVSLYDGTAVRRETMPMLLAMIAA